MAQRFSVLTRWSIASLLIVLYSISYQNDLKWGVLSRNIYSQSRARYFWKVGMRVCCCQLSPSTLSMATIVNIDRASQALSQSLPPNVRRTWAALSGVSDVRLTTLWHRAHGRQSIKEKGQRPAVPYPRGRESPCFLSVTNV